MSDVVPFAGNLKKPIDLRRAPLLAIEKLFSPSSDDEELQKFLKQEVTARLTAFDKLFNLDSNEPAIWENRAKVLLERTRGVSPSDPHWWKSFALYLLRHHVPGFKLNIEGKSHGAPPEWTSSQLNQLFADIEFLRKEYHMTVQDICERLPRGTGYAKRWGKYTTTALCKQYTRAKALQQHTCVEGTIDSCALKLPL
jgi:hypothetical protein